ncbi:Hypp764 [Branchiostoma lanceolatum]|uniref:Hypp764 protein n=1 Tax=Branchiostoma lanceolatum TaxID=7740 RepID=A0A8J9W1L4_BRALA|nr:Hypp764 [Branchiostoma lanceolatum]
MGMSSGSSSSSKTSGTHVTVEGGDQEVASIVADFYSTGFKDTFTEWLKSIPTYPKPIEMFFGTMSELLNLNYKLLFPFDIKDAADGCFSENLQTEKGTGRKFYEVPKLVNNSHGVMTPLNEKRYCDFTSTEKFEEAMDKKRLALERAIVVYMEEGPVPTTDFHLKGGKPGCTTQALKVRGGSAGTTYPTWLELINGDTYKIIFDLPEGISYDITKNREAFVVFARNRWNCHAPGAELHMYNSYKNGGSDNTNNKKVSCFGFVMTYVEATGTFLVTPQDQEASSQVLKDLPRNYANSNVARAEYVSPLEHSQANGGALASIVEAPCTVKWSNSYQIKPAETGGKCLYFVAASAGDIFVVFSAIPRDKTTWYHLQISFKGVALYKGMRLVKYEGAKSARSLGDSKLFQPYFICLEEDVEKTYIKYGIGSDTSEKGLVYMVYIDDSPPLGIRFYSFGSGEEDVEIMDARIIEGRATEVECRGGTVMKDGNCVENCHPECNGDNGVTCVCKDFVVINDDGSTQCVSACPDDAKVSSDGKTCGSKWRDDLRCGESFPATGAHPGQCNPGSPNTCCSSEGWCGNTVAHCTCDGCVDYQCMSCRWLARDSSWVVDSTGTPWVDHGVTYDAAKTLDGDLGTYWNPQGAGQNYNNWNIVLDLATPHTLTRIAVNNFRDTSHDIVAFTLQKSQSGSPYNWEDVTSVDNVQKGTDQRQEFSGFKGTARYWRFTITRTPQGFQPWLRELNLYGISSQVNVALGKTAYQTSTMLVFAARLAVDGNTNSDFHAGSCTHSEGSGEADPSWRVDLRESYMIERVVIFGRNDCCQERLNPFNIHIGDSDQVSANPKCGGDHQIDLNKPSTSISCHGMRGRYVGIRLPGSGRILTLCEVQVFSGTSSPSNCEGK